jgi:hypothetical protein
MVRIDRLGVAFAAAMLAFGIWVVIRAVSLGVSGGGGPGAGAFPMIAGLLVTAFAAAELVRSLRKARAPQDRGPATAENSIGASELARIFGILALIGLYVGLFETLGAFLTLPFLMMGVSLVVHWRTDPRWLASLAALCVGFTAICYYVFAVFLRVLLPVGPLGF